MRACIVGAGAIGCFVGARLARAGVDVTLVARGMHLRALQSAGLALLERDGSEGVHRLRAVERLAQAGAQDLVILAVKAHQVAPIAQELAALPAGDVPLVTMQNGIPWWYFQRRPGPFAGRVVESVDPAGQIAATIAPGSIVGCVVYPACELVRPGVVRHVEGDRFPVGEPDGSLSPRVERISRLFESAGLRSPVLPDIRSEIWLKLWGNLCFNPISALSRATLAEICAEPHTRALAMAMMREAEAVATGLGASFRVPLEKRIEGAARVGHHRTSMLQDVESARSTELDALLGSVIELARLTGTPVPHLEAVYACATLLERTVCAGRGRQAPALAQKAA
ncbi:MAG TPA: 2-dehydropantoate 2-reductase [Usitatibacter sp.]|nr:2-dehydropantoate 2-reductase [Usitatibacter sp.]